MKAVLQYRASPGFARCLAQAGEDAGIATVVVDEDDEATLRRELAHAEVLLHVLKPVTAELIAAAPGLGLIQKLGVGVNTIDLDAARARGVAVCNMPGTNSPAVAEMTLALMLAVLRKLGSLDRATRQGAGWGLDPATYDGVGEIGGRTVGFAGFGAAPARLVPPLEALGARILYTARAPRPERPDDFRPLPELLAKSDIVTLHAPLTAETRGLIGREALARMKPGAILINTARGELVDEAALADALASGRVAGAGLDVFASEPVGPGHPLARFETVVMTPHAAWLTPETLQRSLGIAFENALRLGRGEPLLHRVV